MLDRGSEPCIFEFMKRNQVKLLIIFTALSAGTLLISNLSAVKVLKDGSWKLVEFGEKVPLKDAEKESLTQENLEEADGNPEEESDE